MYKLFLTFRYLTRKAIVVFPILVVWLCVMMMIIVTSFMGGFVDRALDASRQLMGDVVIDSPSHAGWPLYAELQAELAKMPEVISSTPIVQCYGLIDLPQYRANTGVQIIGIDPVGRSKLSNFRETLFRQYSSPMQAVKDLESNLPATGQKLQDAAKKRADNANGHLDALNTEGPRTLSPSQVKWRTAGGAAGLVIAITLLCLLWRWPVRYRWTAGVVVILLVAGVAGFWYQTWMRSNETKQEDLLLDEQIHTQEDIEQADRTYNWAMNLDPKATYKDRQALLDAEVTIGKKTYALVPKEPSFDLPPEAINKFGSAANSKLGCIIGIDVFSGGMFPRDRRGQYRHPRQFDLVDARLTAMPVSQHGTLDTTNAVTHDYAIVDSTYSGVYIPDSTFVYAPFADVQVMAGMNAALDLDDNPVPARCSELEVQVQNSNDPVVLRATAAKIQAKINAFIDAHPDWERFDVRAQTWDEKQAQYINAVRHEKGMITFILGLMSLVVIVVIFLIFYMIVRDKTRDIGIIKALGGSEEGVAGIFMMYGLFIGLVGGILGMVGGVEFMWHTNEIHEWFYRMTGIILWDRSVYLFDRIPDTVNWNEVLLYVGCAVGAGLLGALIPAIVAGSQNPVKAVRFE